MKYTSTLFYAGSMTLVLLSTQAQAQRTRFESAIKSETGIPDKFRTLLPEQGRGFKNTAKTTGLATRLIAVTNYTCDGTNFLLSDSTHYAYSPDRGRIPEDYGAADLVQAWSMSSGSLNLSYKVVNTYNTDKKIISSVSFSWNHAKSTWDTAMQSIYTYDPVSGKLSNSVSQQWQTSLHSWLNTDRTVEGYDASGILITETRQQWKSASSSWEDNFRQNFTYNSKGKNLQYMSESFNPSSMSWNPSGRTTVNYDASDTVMLNAVYETYYTTWSTMGRSKYSYDPSGHVNYIYEQGWDDVDMTWVDDYRELYTYNAKGLMATMSTDYWDDATSTWGLTTNSFKMINYYEDFTLGLSETALRNGTISVYPVPASNDIHIKLEWQRAQACHVTLYDLQGRVWQQWSVPAAASYSDNISVANMPAGNYFIQLKGDDNGYILQQLTVVH